MTPQYIAEYFGIPEYIQYTLAGLSLLGISLHVLYQGLLAKPLSTKRIMTGISGYTFQIFAVIFLFYAYILYYGYTKGVGE